MSIAEPSERLQIPETLRRQLGDFRRRVWTIKTIEAVASAAFGIVAAFLALFALDRFWDTPALPRLGLFGLAAMGCAVVPQALYRWVWRQRRPEQLARLLARKHPRIGDQLLGVIELARDDSEQARSRRLVEAAIAQVAHDSQDRDFRDAVPTPRHKLWLGMLAGPSAVALCLFFFCPDAASNAWSRLVRPWTNTPRYTFAVIEPMPDRLVVAHGERFDFRVQLARSTVSHPFEAQVRVGGRSPVVAPLVDNAYAFELPPQVAKTRLEVRVGDASRVVEVEPMLRPELNSVVVGVTLPEYLARPGSQQKDARSGAISLLKGSQAQVTATVGRELASASVDGSPVAVAGSKIIAPVLTVEAARNVQFRWVDRFGLAAKEPFTVKIASREDEAPTMMIEDLPRQKVVLDTEVIHFKVRAQDDFGVKRVGIEWQGLDRKGVKSPATGDRVLAAGAPDKEGLDVAGTFSARSLRIEPQPIALRVFVEDYLPGRSRVVSPAYVLFVLSPEQHAIWLTEQLSKWHRQSLEVRDREMQLFEENKQLRELANADLDKPENRKKIEAQASAEQANGRKLSALASNGDELVKQAMRNPEFGVGHLDKWAEMLQILKDISANRMPSVADLLKEAARAPKATLASNTPAPGEGKPSQGEGKPGDGETKPNKGEGKPSEGQGKPGDGEAKPNKGDGKASGDSKPSDKKASGESGKADPNKAPKAGQDRSNAKSKPGRDDPNAPPKPPSSVPTIVDGESSQQPPSNKEEKPGPPSPPKTPRLLLPNTTLAGGVRPADPNAPAPPPAPAADKVDEALNQQRDLLAEFEKVSDELNKVLGNLEGSTLVKRLKAASRNQLTVAGKIGDTVGNAFGLGVNRAVAASADALEALAAEEVKGSKTVSHIIDDMSAYFERRRYARFKTVLDEMKEKDVIGSLRQLGDDLKKEQGLSIAQAEFWSDTLDRWAEDLVDPVNSGTCPGSKAKGSLPPSVVLEVLQILEGEINLREETRVADQARPAVAADEFNKQAGALARNQDGLKTRVVKVVDRIKELPDAEAEFANEMKMLNEVAGIMGEATEILITPDTGSPAVAAETDAIELLLQAKRINPKGGGGGGSNPGGGSKASSVGKDSPLALIGNGENQKEVREERATAQASGESGLALPEEFRAGLDQYFNKIEKGPAGR